MKRLKNVLFITCGYPSDSNPFMCSFIGSRLATLQEKGIQTDVLSFRKFTTEEIISFRDLLIYLFLLFLPIVSHGSHTFKGKKYKIFNISYGYFSIIFLPVIILILSKKNHYSILHYHFLWFTNELSLIKKFTHIPSVITVHGCDMNETAVKDPASYMKFKKAIKFADKIIYVSNALQTVSYNIGLATTRDVIIHNGYDPDIFSLTKSRSVSLTLGFIGHLYYEKRADKLPVIFKHIKNELPDTKFIIIGGGEINESLEKLMREKFIESGLINDVIFTGEISQKDVAKYLKFIDILLLPSVREGFGCVAIEARACGVPVVGSSNGGIRESVGTGGIIVPEGENFEERFAKTIIEYSKSLPLREEIHEGVKGFTWDSIVDKEVAIYKEIIRDFPVIKL